MPEVDPVLQVTEHLMNLLLNGKYSFPDDNFLIWRKKKKTKFTVSSRIEIIREMKVSHVSNSNRNLIDTAGWFGGGGV